MRQIITDMDLRRERHQSLKICERETERERERERSAETKRMEILEQSRKLTNCVTRFFIDAPTFNYLNTRVMLCLISSSFVSLSGL